MEYQITVLLIGVLLQLKLIYLNRYDVLRLSSIVTLVAFYYTIPASFLIHSESFNLFPYDISYKTSAEAIEIYSLFVAVTILSQIFLKNSVGNRRQFVLVVKSGSGSSKLLTLQVILLSILFLLNYLDNFTLFREDYSTFLSTDEERQTYRGAIYSLSILQGLLAGYSILLTRRLANPTALVAIICIFIIFFAKMKRLELIIALIPVVWALYIIKWRWLPSPFFLASSAAIFLVIVGMMRVPDPSINWINFFMGFFSEGVNAGHSLIGVLATKGTNSWDYEYGLLLARAIVFSVPTILGGSDKYDILRELSPVPSEQFSPMGAQNFLSDIYLQGGEFSIIIAAIVLAYLNKAFGRPVLDQETKLVNFSLRSLAYIALLVGSVGFLRDDIAISIKVAVQLYIFSLLALFWAGGAVFHKKYLNDSIR